MKTENLNEVKNSSFLAGAVISLFSIEERLRLEKKLIKIIVDKRPYYNTVKKRQVIRDSVADLLDAIIQNSI